MAHHLHDGRNMPIGGGMLRLDLDSCVDVYDGKRVYPRVPIAGLVRLARFLGCEPHGTYASDGAHRHALVRAIARAEALLARAPRARRWDLPPRKTT